jgi:hypothetical protein
LLKIGLREEYRFRMFQDRVFRRNFYRKDLKVHAYEEGHKICWNEAKVLEIERNTIYRKHKESTHMSPIDLPISQPSFDICPIWIPAITVK